MTLMGQEPNMQTWTDAWRKADPVEFKKVYSSDATIFPPNKPTIQGNDNILRFMVERPRQSRCFV